jgi:NDP-sugar pyrophosphorylase family protein
MLVIFVALVRPGAYARRARFATLNHRARVARGRMRFVVLAAGGGKRMGPLTTQTPKVLLPVANRPLMGWTLEGLKRAGADRATLVLNHAEAEMRKFLREQSPIPTKMVRQPRRDGTARGAQAGAGKRPKDPIFLLYGDVFLPEATLTKLAKEPGSWIGTYNVEDASPYGSVETRAGRLVRIHEKTSKPPSRRIFAGVARLEPDVLARLASLKKSARGEYELTDALNQHAGEGGKIRVLDLPEWYEAGRPWHLLGIQERLLRDASGKGERTGAIIEPGARLIGHVEVGAGTRIRSGAYIEGPVVIGREAKIGPNCYLRPTTSTTIATLAPRSK